MSLSIDAKHVTAVLLVDGWHVIEPGTFKIEGYDIRDDGYPLIAREFPDHGFTFVELDEESYALSSVSGPLSSLLALRHRSA